MGKCVFCVLCILCVFLQQNPKKYGQDLMSFFKRHDGAASRQSLTNVFCVFCVFFWSSYVRYYAMHVFYVFYVFFLKGHDRAMFQLPDNH